MSREGTEFLPPDAELERRIAEIGAKLFALMTHAPAPALFSKKGAYGRLMEWSMQDTAFKTQLFRFVDVLPTLEDPDEILAHLREYLGDRAVELHPALKAGLFASRIAPGLAANTIKGQVTAMAREFVAGVTTEDLLKRFRENAGRGIATTIDLLGETVVSEDEADVFLQRNLDLLAQMSAAIAGDRPCFSDQLPNGPGPRLNLSVKISALTPDVNPADPAGSIEALKCRLRPILSAAQHAGALINFDMESYRLKDLTLALFRSILEEPEFAQTPAVGIAIQAYLRDSQSDLEYLITWCRDRGRAITVRLVKGAYWDYETILARQRHWPVPVWSQKAETDAAFEKLTLLLLKNADIVAPAFASHNVRSCAHAIARAEQLQLDPRIIEFQALYGMADDLKSALIASGYRVREYCPIGELLPGMAYLVRRLLENTSNESFLRRRHDRGEAAERLLVNPVTLICADKKPNHPDEPRRFVNVPNSDFARADARAHMLSALEKLRRTPPATAPLLIGGRPLAEDRARVDSVNPARPSDVVGKWIRATPADAEAAVQAARKAFPIWAAKSFSERADWLDRVGDLLSARRFVLSALEVHEAGKPWAEADADISEAIDFCRFYAAEARRIGEPRVTQRTPGEFNQEHFVPRGVGAIIAPWNFPLAILCGMTGAAAVTGNAVILKPAEQTSMIAAAFGAILLEAGVPDGAVNLLTGYGDVGAHLVAHRDVDFVAFTGSRAVGLQIWETVGRTAPGQRNLKKAVCEMGGKNALIVDQDADWDEAIPAVLYSTFGFSGQKCSALSRLIVHEKIADEFIARLIAAARALRVGDPADPATVVGPVIDADAQAKILELIEVGQREAHLAYQAVLPKELAATGGYYVPPTIFTRVPRDARIAREEIFGPVLAVLVAKNLDEAIEIANDTEYALTAGMFSRRPSALERARRELVAGNVYLNRGITGAIVERHPFGGYKMSGGGTKAGGRGYLENFLFPRVVSENTLRRGFTPPEEGE